MTGLRAFLPRATAARGLQDGSLLLVLALLLAVFSALSDRFFQADNFANLVMQASAVAAAAVGMTLVVMTAGIDLSVGSGMNLALVTAVAVAGAPGEMAYTTQTGWLVYPVALIAGALLGVVNAVLILRLRLSPLIATLGTLTLYRGLALHVTGSNEMLVFGAIRSFGRGVLAFGIGAPVFAVLALALATALFLRHVSLGRFILAVGGAERSARETGLPTGLVMAAVYGFAGLTAALAGLIVVGRVGAINPDLGWQFEFTVITAVVLGGTSLFGGRGSIFGSVIAALVLATVSNGLNLIGANPFVYDVIRGGVLLGAVGLDALSRRGRAGLAAG